MADTLVDSKTVSLPLTQYEDDGDTTTPLASQSQQTQLNATSNEDNADEINRIKSYSVDHFQTCVQNIFAKLTEAREESFQLQNDFRQKNTCISEEATNRICTSLDEMYAQKSTIINEKFETISNVLKQSEILEEKITELKQRLNLIIDKFNE